MGRGLWEGLPLSIAHRFAQGLTYQEFLDRFDVPRNRQRIEEVDSRVALAPGDQDWFARLRPLQLKVLVLGATWCPDVFQHLPVLMRVAEYGGFEVRIFDRDANPDLRDRWAAWDGKHRIPVFVFFDAQWQEVGRWYERCRRMDMLLEEGRAVLPPKDHPDHSVRTRELYQRLGEEYDRGWPRQEAVREMREVLAPLLARDSHPGRTVRALDLFPHRNDFRQALWPALEKLSPEQLEWTPPGSKNSIAGYLRHMAQAEDWWVHRVILGTDFQPKRKADLPDLPAILAYLRRTRQQTEALLAEWTLEKLLTETRSLPPGEFRGGQYESPTLYWCFQRIFWHEVYHGAQILLVMRQQGMEPPVI